MCLREKSHEGGEKNAGEGKKRGGEGGEKNRYPLVRKLSALPTYDRRRLKKGGGLGKGKKGGKSRERWRPSFSTSSANSPPVRALGGGKGIRKRGRKGGERGKEGRIDTVFIASLISVASRLVSIHGERSVKGGGGGGGEKGRKGSNENNYPRFILSVPDGRLLQGGNQRGRKGEGKGGKSKRGEEKASPADSITVCYLHVDLRPLEGGGKKNLKRERAKAGGGGGEREKKEEREQTTTEGRTRYIFLPISERLREIKERKRQGEGKGKRGREEGGGKLLIYRQGSRCEEGGNSERKGGEGEGNVPCLFGL